MTLFSILLKIKYSTIKPITEMIIMIAITKSILKKSRASINVRPKPPRPISSAAINARHPNAQASLAPVKADGMEAGIMTFQISSVWLYPIVLAALINRGGTFLIPILIFMVIAHVPPNTTTKIIAVEPP